MCCGVMTAALRHNEKPDTMHIFIGGVRSYSQQHNVELYSYQHNEKVL